jgi:HSP20 family molecular chaperone IbpA
MASQTTATKSIDSASPIAIQREHQGHLTHRANGAISRRAYELFEKSGGIEGQELSHWLQAESEILTRIPEIREASSWYTVNATLQGFSPEEIQVGVDASQAIIVADKAQSTDKGETGDGTFSGESRVLLANWPTPVDPATASAYFKNERLTLTVKRAATPVPAR